MLRHRVHPVGLALDAAGGPQQRQELNWRARVRAAARCIARLSFGLVRAFLFAGADNVLATLWPVGDRSAAAVMRDLYQSLAPGRAFPEAIAAAQRRALKNPVTADPVHWAAFELVGAAR